MATIKHKVRLNVVAEDGELLDTIELEGRDLKQRAEQADICFDIECAANILTYREERS